MFALHPSRVFDRRSVVVALAVVLVAACTGEPVPSRAPISAELVRSREAGLRAVVDGHAEAWARRDSAAILGYWDEHTVHEDTGFGVELQGAALFSMPDSFFIDYPGFAWEIDDVLIGDGVALDVSRGWGVELRGHTFTRDAPMLEIDRTEIGADGTIGRWTLYYGLETYDLWSPHATRVESTRQALAQYTAAWGSGRPAEVAGLYSTAARRIDSLFGLEHQGRDAIERWARDFFRWYPSVRLEPGVAFSDNLRSMRDPERMGSLFQMTVTDPGGSTCSLVMAVVLAVREGRIIDEELFWNAGDVIECGWAS